MTTLPDYQHNVVTVTRQELLHIALWMDRRGLKKVLEFGSGISTHMFGLIGECDSFEDNEDYAKGTRGLVDTYGPSNYKVHPWGGREAVPVWVFDTQWDMVFVDGPADSAWGHYGRRGAIKAASTLMNIGKVDYVWLHDAWEHQVIDNAVRYLSPIARLREYPEWSNPNPYFLGASMLLWEKIR